MVDDRDILAFLEDTQQFGLQAGADATDSIQKKSALIVITDIDSPGLHLKVLGGVWEPYTVEYSKYVNSGRKMILLCLIFLLCSFYSNRSSAPWLKYLQEGCRVYLPRIFCSGLIVTSEEKHIDFFLKL